MITAAGGGDANSCEKSNAIESVPKPLDPRLGFLGHRNAVVLSAAPNSRSVPSLSSRG